MTALGLVFGVAVGFALGWHMGTNQSMDAAYQSGIEQGRNKVEEAKYAAQTAASNAKIAQINQQIETEKQKNAQQLTTNEEATTPSSRRNVAPQAPVAEAPVTGAPEERRQSWSELEVQRAQEVRAEQEARRRAEEQARADQEIAENQYYYLSGGMYHRYGCPYLQEPLVRAKLKDARLAAVPCSYCKPPR